MGTPRRKIGPAFRRIAIGSTPVEEGVGAVVSVLRMTLEEQVHMTITVKVRRQNPGGRVGRDAGHSVGGKAAGSVPVDVGGIAASVPAVIAGEYQIEVPIPVQIRSRRLLRSQRRKDQPMSLRVGFLRILSAPVDEGVTTRGSSIDQRKAALRMHRFPGVHPGRKGWSRSGPDDRSCPGRPPLPKSRL